MRAVTSLCGSGVASLHTHGHERISADQVRLLQKFANELKWPPRPSVFAHTLTSSAEVTLGEYQINRVRSLTVTCNSGIHEGKRASQIAAQYRPTILTIAAPANVDLSDFKTVTDLRVTDAFRNGSERITVRCTRKVTHVCLGRGVEFDGKSEHDLKAGELILRDTTLSAVKHTGAAPLRIEYHGTSTKEKQADIQKALLSGHHAEIAVRSDNAVSGALVPWVHIAADLKLPPPQNRRPEVIDFGGCLNASVGFLSSRTFTALKYSDLKHISLTILPDDLPGTTTRLLEFITALGSEAFKLAYIELRAPSLPAGAATIIAAQLLGRMTELGKRSALLRSSTKLAEAPVLVLIVSDPEANKRVHTEVFELASLFQQRKLDERMEFMMQLAADPKNKERLRTYLDVTDGVRMPMTRHHSELYRVTAAHAYDPVAARQAIAGIFAIPTQDVGTRVYAESEDSVFCIASSVDESVSKLRVVVLMKL